MSKLMPQASLAQLQSWAPQLTSSPEQRAARSPPSRLPSEKPGRDPALEREFRRCFKSRAQVQTAQRTQGPAAVPCAASAPAGFCT